jgi:HPt (histidine-containing phosphotransfer) domain-containing protein
MDDYVSKPIDPAQLFTAINRCLPDAVGIELEMSFDEDDSDASDDPPEVAKGPRIVDFEAAESRIGGRDAVKTLALILMEECPKLLDQMDQAIGAGDAKLLQRAAHTLKGSSSHFFAEAVCASAEVLEQFGRDQQLQDAPQAFDQVRRDVAKLLAKIRSTFMK